jgi:CDP-diacylglycerol--glycerol-3-phosphate 3-phosphatidyltransferase
LPILATSSYVRQAGRVVYLGDVWCFCWGMQDDDDAQGKEASLKTELSKVAFLGSAILIFGAGLLGLYWHWQGAGQWILQAGILWGFLCYQGGRRLHLNRPARGAPLYGNLGWGNRLTLLRSWLIAAVGGFLFQGWPDGLVLAWIPGSLYLFAAVLDRIDGFVARRTGRGSLFGEELDMVSDALGLAVASLLAYGYSQVHISYLLLGVAYYLFHGGLTWRKLQCLPIHPLPPALHRRAWAGFQMGFLVVALWPMFRPPVVTIAGFAFMLPALIGFVLDWLIVSGRIDRNCKPVDRFFCRLNRAGQSVVQPVLRLAIAVMLAMALGQFDWRLLPEGEEDWLSVLWTGGAIFAVVLILLGIAGRIACLVLVGLLGWRYSEHPMHAFDFALFCIAIWQMLLGTGRFSLWTEDEHWINRHDGA